MSNRKLISVVLPSYNDREIILPLYEAMCNEFKDHERYDYEIIYVDDGSSDGSQHTLKQLAEQDPSVTFIELFRNYGQQRALFAGLSIAKGDYVVTLDGDFQYGPEVVNQLVDAMGDEYDAASGIRTRRKDPLWGKLTSRVGNNFIRNILKVDIQDFGSVKAFSRDLVNQITAMKHQYSDVYPAALSLHPKLVEVPVIHKDRYAGSSHWNLFKRIRLYVDLFISYGDHQFDIIFKTGLTGLILTPILLVYLICHKLFFSHSLTYTEIIFISALSGAVSLFVSSWAIQMGYIIRIYKQNVSSSPVTLRKVHKSTPSVDPEGTA